MSRYEFDYHLRENNAFVKAVTVVPDKRGLERYRQNIEQTYSVSPQINHTGLSYFFNTSGRYMLFLVDSGLVLRHVFVASAHATSRETADVMLDEFMSTSGLDECEIGREYLAKLRQREIDVVEMGIAAAQEDLKRISVKGAILH